MEMNLYSTLWLLVQLVRDSRLPTSAPQAVKFWTLMVSSGQYIQSVDRSIDPLTSILIFCKFEKYECKLEIGNSLVVRLQEALNFEVGK